MSQDERLETSVEQAKEEEVYPHKKMDVKSLAAIVPPASTLFSRQKVLSEKRIRVRYGEVGEDEIKISPQLAAQLGISERAELVVAGRKKFSMKVTLDESVPMDVAIANPQVMRESGVADNSIATLRKA